MNRKMTEDEWWDAFCDRQEKAEAEAFAYAEDFADWIEFDTDEEREKFVAETYSQRLAELLDA